MKFIQKPITTLGKLVKTKKESKKPWMHNSSPLPYYGQIKNTFYQLLACIQSQSYVSRYYVQYVSGLDQAPGTQARSDGTCESHGLIENNMFNDFVNKALS